MYGGRRLFASGRRDLSPGRNEFERVLKSRLSTYRLLEVGTETSLRLDVRRYQVRHVIWKAKRQSACRSRHPCDLHTA